MKDKTVDKMAKGVLWFFGAFFLWLSITTNIQAFKCPQLTQTQLIIKMPKSFILQFECDCGTGVNRNDEQRGS